MVGPREKGDEQIDVAALEEYLNVFRLDINQNEEFFGESS